MKYENLKKQIEVFCELSATDLETVMSKFMHCSFKQKEYILVKGQISAHIHFIEQGLVRVFHLRDGKETTTYLSSDHGFVSSYSSFINQQKSIENIQCLEDTETLSISFKSMQELYERIPPWEKVGRILAEQNFLCLADRLLKLQSTPAKEKYLEFLKTAPAKIVQRTPLIHVASFLGIAPESLSRIRKNIS